MTINLDGYGNGPLRTCLLRDDTDRRPGRYNARSGDVQRRVHPHDPTGTAAINRRSPCSYVRRRSIAPSLSLCWSLSLVSLKRSLKQGPSQRGSYVNRRRIHETASRSPSSTTRCRALAVPSNRITPLYVQGKSLNPRPHPAPQRPRPRPRCHERGPLRGAARRSVPLCVRPYRAPLPTARRGRRWYYWSRTAMACNAHALRTAAYCS